ncbi:hypothetical protein [Halobacteriovorax sp. JY17]|uniref:hypothetical protein n=1 Tax=Halobacteriovorax sp. JY17 TaxID=2014617 RepID=UPI000C532F28|nr:hypothetical protein [Halobacteriovorax sp. JY17]PIK14662.1 MAG: hypothetical protein CES88_10000 [Halobacteriovorax sp. JY17]
MKKLLLISTLFLSIFSASADQSTSRTYIVNTDGTVTFLNRVIPNQDETGRTYIVNEDGTIEFLDRIAPLTNFDVNTLENFQVDITEYLEKLN